jgi:hypothetical protein
VKENASPCIGKRETCNNIIWQDALSENPFIGNPLIFLIRDRQLSFGESHLAGPAKPATWLFRLSYTLPLDIWSLAGEKGVYVRNFIYCGERIQGQLLKEFLDGLIHLQMSL